MTRPSTRSGAPWARAWPPRGRLCRGAATSSCRRNYRSRAPILDAARRLIRHNGPDRLEVIRGVDKTLTAVRRSRRPAMVTHRALRTASAEADAVAADIQARHRRRAAAPGSFAVLVRTNADAAPVLASLDVLGDAASLLGCLRLAGPSRGPRRAQPDAHRSRRRTSSEDLYAVMTATPYGLGGEDLTADLRVRRPAATSALVGRHRAGRATRACCV